MKKLFVLMMLLLSFGAFAQNGEEQLSEPFFGDINGHDISSFEPCVYRSNRGGWYDHCFFSLEGTNDFGEEVSPEAKQCAVKSNNVLYGWLSDKEGPVERAYSILERAYGSKYIYIIVTDTVGSTIQNRDRAVLWTWQEGNGKGTYFKFNIGVSTDGTCHIPSEDQMILTIKNWVGEDKFLQLAEQMYGAEEPEVVEPVVVEPITQPVVEVSESPTSTILVEPVSSSSNTEEEQVKKLNIFQKIFGTKASRKARRAARKERRKARRKARRERRESRGPDSVEEEPSNELFRRTNNWMFI